MTTPDKTGSLARPGSRFEFVARPGHRRERLDRLVVKLLQAAGVATTRADVQRWIAQGLVAVDGEPATRQARGIADGARVSVEIGAGLRSEALPDPSVRFDVVFEDEHLLVIAKPAGLVVHPARGHRHGTLVNGLLARGGLSVEPADPRDPEGHLRPGIVHRLDKDTSGLLVVAKTAPVREGLKELFARHDIERRYTAIVMGRAQPATYDTPYGRDPRNRLRFTSNLARPDAKRAITQVTPRERLGTLATLVECRLQTGRTHQIRVHLAEQAGTPVLGDPLYGPPEASHPPALAPLARELGRQALHAEMLGFDHPITGEHHQWHQPLPADMQRALDALRNC